MNTMPQFLGCFVKCFYFVWSKSISACQKCPSESASIAVPTWCAVSIARFDIVTATGWRVVGNVNVMAPTESRSIRRAVVYGLSVITIQPCLRQFHRRPSWLVNQREKKCLGIISSLAAAGTCWKNKRWKGWSDAQASFKNSNSYRQENILILLVIINSLLSSKDFSLLKSVFLILSLFLLKYRKIPSIPLVISLNYEVKQSKNGNLTIRNYKASPIDFETQISLRR